MKIPPLPLPAPEFNSKTRRRFLLILLALVSVVGFFAYRLSQDSKDRTPGYFSNRDHFLKINAQPEAISIHLTYKAFQHLSYQREEAMNAGFLVGKKGEYVSGLLKYGADEIPIRIRLKGDLTDHLDSDLWSFRVKTTGEQTLFGMKNFSLQHPKTRNFAHEWIFYRALAHEGLIHLRYRFVRVKLNNEDLGLYALEEHFEKRLIENNRRREGVIVKFNEDLWWEERAQFGFFEKEGSTRLPRSTSGYGHYFSSPVDSFEMAKLIEDPDRFEQFKRAASLLEGFRRGDLIPSEVFAVDQLARAFAICDILGSHHPLSANQLRFYLNPITEKLEPILFDFEGGNRLGGIAAMWQLEDDDQHMRGVQALLVERLFRDMAFFEAYIAALVRMSETTYLDGFLAGNQKELDRVLSVLYHAYPDYVFSASNYFENQRYVRSLLDPKKPFHAYVRGMGEDSIQLDLGSLQTFPSRIIDLRDPKGETFPVVGSEVLPPKLRRLTPVAYHGFSFKKPGGERFDPKRLAGMTVRYQLLGTENIRETEIFPWPYLVQNLIASQQRLLKPNAEVFSFLEKDEAKRLLTAKKGRWTIDQILVIPSGFTFVIQPGTQLDLKSRARIVSHSPLRWVGKAEDPIKIFSSDRTGQGLLVLSPKGRSEMKHVQVTGMGAAAGDDGSLSGALTFYEAPIDIFHSRFERNTSGDDLVNVIRSPFRLESVVFAHTPADAFDADFSDGTMKDVSFSDIGNDAIDLSGSAVKLSRAKMQGVKDKAISVGERSTLELLDVEIENATYGLVSKDLSEVSGARVVISTAEVGLALFQKKSEFGPATITLRQSEIKLSQRPFLIERASKLSFNGEQKSATERFVAQTLYAKDEND